MKLTETIVEKLIPSSKPVLHSDDLVKGLYLKVSTAGRKSFQFRTRRTGAWEVVTLGHFPLMSLAEARRKSAAFSDAGAPTEVLTFSDLLTRWFEARIEPRYKRTANAQVYVTRGAASAIGSKRVDTIKTREFVQVLQQYAKAFPVAANRCLSTWKLALDWGVETGVLESNPLARTTSRAVGGEEVTRSRTLTDAEIIALWADTHDHAPLLKALLLTGCRISELQDAKVEHLDGDILHIPENKSQRPHWVHVTPQLRQLFGDFDGHLFEQRSNTAVQSRLRREAMTWTPHDLRRTCATRMNALHVAPHVVEKVLNHSMQGVMATYNRHDYAEERIEAAKLWSDELGRLVAEKK
jgi:integrase